MNINDELYVDDVYISYLFKQYIILIIFNKPRE